MKACRGCTIGCALPRGFLQRRRKQKAKQDPLALYWEHAPSPQADAGAQAVQIFDSWASELQPQDFDVFAGPYIQKIIDSVRKSHPDLTIILYISGSGGLLERMAACKPDVVSVDQRVDMADAIQRIGPDFAVQVQLSLPKPNPKLQLSSFYINRHIYATAESCLRIQLSWWYLAAIVKMALLHKNSL